MTQMFMEANLFSSIARLLDLAITLYILALIIRAVLSWISHDPYSGFVRFIYDITEPALARIRAIIPPISGLDLSPMILIILLYIIQSILSSY